MKPILHTITKERLLLPLVWLGILLGLHNPLQAQTCPSGWTSTTGTIYPVSATGYAFTGHVNNIVFGGADGNFVRPNPNLIVNFGQTLAAGGTVDILANRASGSFNANFYVSFSADGINYSAPTLVSVPGSQATFATYTVTAPSAFQYVKLASVDLSKYNTQYDAISYNGTYCKAPIVSYASCASGESQAWNMVMPIAAAGSFYDQDYAINGPDGYVTDLPQNTFSLLLKYSKALAAGDTILIVGYKKTTLPGSFQVLTSMDGLNFTALATNAFTSNIPNLQTIKIAATQPFQYIKLESTGTGEITLDVVKVFAKNCVTASGSCNLTYTAIPPQTATGNPNSGGANSVLTKDGTVANFTSSTRTVTVDLGQTLLPDGDITVVASTNSYSPVGDFYIYTSTDNVNFTLVGRVVNDFTSLQTFELHVPIAFRYIKMVPHAASAPSIKIDYISAMGLVCPPCLVTGVVTATQATCGTAGGSNADAKLTLTSYTGGATKVGYSTGSSYTGPAYAAATALTAAPMTLAATLPNPTSTQPYTVRVFQDASCYKDYLVTIDPKVCLTADLSVTASPATASGAKGEFVSYTFTLTNAGPDAAPGVTACIPIPANTAFLSATTSQGTYNSGTTIWDLGAVAVGSQTITVTLKMK